MPKTFSKRQITSFQKKVYSVVKRIPIGKVMSYGQVAAILGAPKAFRAVGNALNRNPDMKTVPCHRVVKSDGRVGGYRKGQREKIRILEKEGVLIKNKRVVL